MVKFKGIEITVQVAGTNLKEYEDDDEAGNDDGKTVAKYVEAASGAPFAVRVRVPRKYKMTSNALAFYISADGMKGGYPMMTTTSFEQAGQQGWVNTTTGVKAFVQGHWEQRDWHFSDIQLTEEPNLATSQHVTPTGIASLGSITVQVHRLNEIGVKRKSTEEETANRMNPNEALKLTEKKLKGGTLTHSTTLGRAKRIAPRTSSDVRYLDGFNSPFATFKFKYRSKRALQSLLLIPRSPSPGPILPLEERDVDTLTPQELQELARRHQARYRQEQQSTVKPERAVLKREREQDDDDSDTVTIVDTRAKRAKARPSADIESVDLTG